MDLRERCLLCRAGCESLLNIELPPDTCSRSLLSPIDCSWLLAHCVKVVTQEWGVMGDKDRAGDEGSLLVVPSLQPAQMRMYKVLAAPASVFDSPVRRLPFDW